MMFPFPYLISGGDFGEFYLASTSLGDAQVGDVVIVTQVTTSEVYSASHLPVQPLPSGFSPDYSIYGTGRYAWEHSEAGYFSSRVSSRISAVVAGVGTKDTGVSNHQRTAVFRNTLGLGHYFEEVSSGSPVNIANSGASFFRISITADFGRFSANPPDNRGSIDGVAASYVRNDAYYANPTETIGAHRLLIEGWEQTWSGDPTPSFVESDSRMILAVPE